MDRLGRYELVRHLASGGMSEVHLARVTGLAGFDRHVALKLVTPERADCAAMLLDEARLMSALHHQHVGQVFEVGVEDDTYFLAMEYLHGESVRSVLNRARQRRVMVPRAMAMTIASAVAAALDYAHERCDSDGNPLGIIHRDVSPSNVIAGYDGSVKLIDFGIAKAFARACITEVGTVKGKRGYMAPEQALGYPIDRRVDIFALGVMTYELTVGRRPFHGATAREEVDQMLRGELVRPSQVLADYPRALEEVVVKALAHDPGDRFASAGDLHAALVDVAGQLRLPIGPAPIVHTLRALFGVRREPWLAPPPVSMVAEVPTQVMWGAPAFRPVFPPMPMPSPLPPPEPPRAIANGSGAVPIDRVAQAAVPVALPRGNARVRRYLPLAGAAAALGAFLALCGVFAGGADPPLPLASAPTPATTPTPAPPIGSAGPPLFVPMVPLLPTEPPPVSPTATVMLDVVTSPPDATVVLEGRRLGRAPLSLAVPRSTKPLVLKVRKTGYVPMRVVIPFEHDVTWRPALVRRH